jgi:hypothetical protein
MKSSDLDPNPIFLSGRGDYQCFYRLLRVSLLAAGKTAAISFRVVLTLLKKRPGYSYHSQTFYLREAANHD